MQRLTFGSITVDAVIDGELGAPLASMLPTADLVRFAAIGGVDAATGVATLPLTTFVIRSAGKLALVDTGIGPDLGSLGGAGFSGAVGHLPGALRGAGIAPGDVDFVVFTHLHADHIGWNVTTDGDGAKVTFPNARYIVHRPEWAFWSGTKSKDISRLMRPVEASGQLDVVDDGFEPLPGVTLLSTPGHTAGHVSVLVAGGGAGGVITGDAAHHPGELEEPTIAAVFDADPALAVASRIALVKRIEADGLTVMGGHFPAPSTGQVVRVEARRTWRWLGA